MSAIEDAAHDHQGEQNHGPAKPGFLTRLMDYKEFVAILVFFIGGAMWIWGYFATKSQLDDLHCLMNANVTLIQGKMDAASISQTMVDNVKAASLLKQKASAGPLTPAELDQQTRLKLVADELSAKLTAANAKATQALDSLRRGDCAH